MLFMFRQLTIRLLSYLTLRLKKLSISLDSTDSRIFRFSEKLETAHGGSEAVDLLVLVEDFGLDTDDIDVASKEICAPAGIEFDS